MTRNGCGGDVKLRLVAGGNCTSVRSGVDDTAQRATIDTISTCILFRAAGLARIARVSTHEMQS